MYISNWRCSLWEFVEPYAAECFKKNTSLRVSAQHHRLFNYHDFHHHPYTGLQIDQTIKSSRVSILDFVLYFVLPEEKEMKFCWKDVKTSTRRNDQIIEI